MQFKTYTILFGTLLITLSCTPTLKQGKMKKHVDFNEVYHFAELSGFAYESNDTINKRYGSDVFALHALPKYDGNYFILKNDVDKTLTISIRGTANFENAVVDGEYLKVKDSKLDIYLHDGFKKSTDELYASLKPILEPFKESYKVNITGHSLGGAMAAILMMYMEKDNYKVDRIITFGQPKVTNENGVKKYQNTSLLRIVDEKDIVPLVPPLTIVSALHGQYRHFGTEVILLNNEFFVFLEEPKAEETKVTSFWDNILNESLKDHFIKNYLKHIKTKLSKQTEVPFNNRLNYE